MAGKLRRKGTPYDPAKAMVYDRQAKDLPKMVEEKPFLVVDPFGDEVVTTRNLRSDPLAWLHDRKHIDQAAYDAGRAYQKDWERCSTSIRAIDYGRPQVDGGLPPASGTSDDQLKAMQRLIKADEKLGEEGTIIAREVLIDGCSKEDMARNRGLTGKMWADYYGKRFREALETLAVVYQMSGRVKRVEEIVE